jgi:translation elongation factor EF-4
MSKHAWCHIDGRDVLDVSDISVTYQLKVSAALGMGSRCSMVHTLSDEEKELQQY